MRGTMYFPPVYKSRRNLLLAALAPLVLTAGCGGGSGGSSVDPRAVPTFAFVSDKDGNLEIYLARDNANTQTRLTNDPGSDVTPSVSPDGRKVVFSSNRDGNSEIYLVNSDGSGLQRLTEDTGSTLPSDTEPAFSPNGQSIAWISTRGGRTNVWLMDVTGTNQRRLTNFSAGLINSPAWSPSGTQVAFVFNDAVSSTIRLINAGGGSATLTGAIDSDTIQSPSFNAAGTKIAFTTRPRRDGSPRSGILDLATKNVTAGPTSGVADLDEISWSHTNDLLIYSGNTISSSGNQIFASDSAGTERRQLTTIPQNFQPSF